jgi:hypothetical protein
MALDGRQKLNLRTLFLQRITNDGVYASLDKRYQGFSAKLYIDVAPSAKLEQMVTATIDAASIPELQVAEAQDFLTQDFRLSLSANQKAGFTPLHYGAASGFTVAAMLGLDVGLTAKLLEQPLTASIYALMAGLLVLNIGAIAASRYLWRKGQTTQLQNSIKLEVE